MKFPRHPCRVSIYKDLSHHLLHLTLVILPVILEFSCNLRFMPDSMLGTFFVVAVVVVVVLGGLPEQIHDKKHFALPKIPAFQSNT